MNERLTEDWRRVCDRWTENGYASLAENERLWLNVRSLIDSVQGGGLVSYFYNSGADTYQDCLSALHHLQADDAAKQVARLGALFGGPVPSNIEERNDVISSWPDDGPEDDVVEETDDVLMPLMDALEHTLDEYLLRQGFGH